MKTYKELKEFINDLESDLDRYYKFPYNDFLINAIIKENENCLKFYKRIKHKFTFIGYIHFYSCSFVLW